MCKSSAFIPVWLPVTFSEQNEEHPDHLWAPSRRKVEQRISSRKTYVRSTWREGGKNERKKRGREGRMKERREGGREE